MAMAGYKPVIEICGGTEIGGGFLAGCMLQPQSPSTFSTPTMGEQILIQPLGTPYTDLASWLGIIVQEAGTVACCLRAPEPCSVLRGSLPVPRCMLPAAECCRC